ncbi:hypothetical protein [Sphingomonas sp. ERG5]|uniref:hypothetical protein n=1 Tax=Sphingomonas sp. ERG5 TaxID=1381597 RepID=UPI00054B78AD|nr:hypothetical protein [Sphingomonas sp. ERG5]
MELTATLTPTVGAMLDRLAPTLVPPLFDTVAVERLRTLSLHLPSARFLLFERHLGSGASRVDLSIGQVAHWPDALRPMALSVDPDTLCLEYDLDGDAGSPALFHTVRSSPPLTGTALAALATGLLEQMPAPMHDMLARAAAAQVADESWITHVGAMFGRAGRPIRVNIGASSAAALRRYAVNAGCGSGPLAALDRLVSLVEGLPVSFILALELGAVLSSRIGIELYMPPPEQAVAAVLDRFVGYDLCCRDEAEAILAWPDEADRGGPRWPEPLHSLDVLLGPRHRGHAARALGHLKLVAETDGTVRAKAYLAAFYRRGATRPAMRAA